MINLLKIEQATLRFKLLTDNLIFKTFDKEVRCNSRLIYTALDKETAEELTNKFNETLAEVIQEEYDRMMNELKDADESSSFREE